MANDIVNYQAVITDIKGIISSGREVAYNAINKAMVLTYLPTKEQLKAEIERQKEIFYMQYPALSEKDKGDDV